MKPAASGEPCPGHDLTGEQYVPLAVSPKGLGGAPFFWRKKPILEQDIFTFHSHPQTGGICPVPESDALSSQAPTDVYHPGREDDRLFLGCICMSPLSLSGCSIVGAERQLDLLTCASREKASRASRTYFQLFPRSHRRVRSPFLELVENLTADEALQKTYLYMANIRCGFSRWRLRLVQLCAVMLRHQLTSMDRAKALCRVLAILDLSFPS